MMAGKISQNITECVPIRGQKSLPYSPKSQKDTTILSQVKFKQAFKVPRFSPILDILHIFVCV